MLDDAYWKKLLGTALKSISEHDPGDLDRLTNHVGQEGVQGQSGAGAVRITFNSHFCVEEGGVEIDPCVCENREILAALIAAAINDARRKLFSSSSLLESLMQLSRKDGEKRRSD